VVVPELPHPETPTATMAKLTNDSKAGRCFLNLVVI
jgi:hypothetical protein